MYRLILGCFILLLLAGCAGPHQLGFSNQAWNQMAEPKRKALLADYEYLQDNPYQIETVYNGPDIDIYMLNGEAMMPPFEQEYSFQNDLFRMKPGECESIRLRSIDTDHSVSMRVCYDGLYVSMDPSRYDKDKRRGTVHFAYNPIWKRGFTYSNVKTTGYARLRHASISIKAIPEKVPVENDNDS